MIDKIKNKYILTHLFNFNIEGMDFEHKKLYCELFFEVLSALILLLTLNEMRIERDAAYYPDICIENF